MNVKNLNRLIAIIIAIYSGLLSANAQSNKVKISLSNPVSLSVCGPADSFDIEIRNITISTITGLSAIVTLPAGVDYVPGSVSGTGVGEKNISNLQQPVFSLPDIPITASSIFKIKVIASCIVLNTINNGGFLTTKVTANYTGGSDALTGNAWTARVPSIVINSITNKSYTGAIAEKFVRIIELKNFGTGSLGSVKFFQKNGPGLKVVYVAGGKTSISADTIWHLFDSIQFKSAGNKDNWLDQNESVFIYDTLEIGACGNLLSDFNASWGCKGQTCQTRTDKGNVIIKNISPVLLITPRSTIHNCFGSDSVYAMGLTVINRGSDKARNVVIDIFQAVGNGNYTAMFSRMDSASIKVKKGNNGVPQALNPTDVIYNRNDGLWSCLGANPLGGFTWRINELAAGDTLFIDWNSLVCCVSACNTTRYSLGWRFAGSYYDQCYNNIGIPETWGAVYQALYLTATSFSPSDIASGETKEMIHTIGSAALPGMNSNSVLTFNLVLGKGVTHSLNANDFIIEAANGSTWKPSTLQQKGDTVTAIFKNNNVNLAQAELKIRITGDCAGLGKTTDVNYSLSSEYQANPSCKQECRQLLYCTSGSIKVHCPVNCGGGMNFKNFKVERISYGLPDNNDDGIADTTGTLDTAAIKTYIAMYSDTLLSTYSGIVTQSGSTFFWDYGYAYSSVLYGNYLKIVDATIEVYRGNKLRFSCNSVAYSSNYSGNYGYFNFDFSRSVIASKGCSGASGYRLASGDSVCLKVRYRVDSNTGGTSLEARFNNYFYLGLNANPTGNQRLQCDTFNGNLVITGYYFTNYGPANYTANGCGDVLINQNYYLSIGPCCGNYAGGNLFRKEYRNWARIAEIKMKLPPGYAYQSGYTYYFRTAGTLGTNYILTNPIFQPVLRNDSVVFNFRNQYLDSGGKYYPSDDGFLGYLYARIKPSCETVNGVSQSIGYDMIFDGKPMSLSSNENISSGSSSDNITFYKADIVLSAVTNKILATTDTAEWIVRLTNRSLNADATYTWLGFGNNAGFTVHIVIDLGTGLPVPQVNGIFKCGALRAGGVANYIVKATYTTCNYDSLKVLAGWDCLNYPDSVSANNCPPQEVIVYFEPVPTLLQSSISGMPSVIDLCSNIPVKVTLTNSDIPKAYNVKLKIYLPEGMNIKDSALNYKIHRDSAYKKLLYPSTLSGNVREWNLSANLSELSNGMWGIEDTLANTIILTFFVETDCNFSSGAFIRALPSATIRCGAPARASVSLSKNIAIKGIVEPFYTDVKLIADTAKPCSENELLTYRIIYLGPKLTDSTSRFRIALTPTYIFDSTSYVNYRNGPASAPDITDYNGAKILEFKLPINIPAGDSSYFSFSLKPRSPYADCGILPLLAQVAVKQKAVCVKDSSTCLINVITGQNYTEKPVKKAIISLLGIKSTSKVASTNFEYINCLVDLKNNGESIVNRPWNLLLIADRNKNGIFDNQDTVYANAYADSFLTGQSKKINFQAFVKTSDMCNLAVLTDSQTCSCSGVFSYVNNIQLINAGNDTTLCSSAQLLLGNISQSGYRYKWNLTTVSNDTISSPLLKLNNPGLKDSTYQLVLTTYKGQCFSIDTVMVTYRPAIRYTLADSVYACEKDTSLIGAAGSGGTGTLTFNWKSDAYLYDLKTGYARIFPPTPGWFFINIADGAGCKLTDSTFASIAPKPLARFNFNLPCEGTSLQLVDSSNYKLTGANTSVFLLADTLIKSGSIVLKYPDSLSVKLRISNAAGCRDSLIRGIVVLPKPKVDFSYSLPCSRTDINFISQSTIQKGTLDSFYWYFGSTLKRGSSTLNKYSDSGYYTVGLQIYSGAGCNSRKDTLLEILEKPVAEMYSGIACFGDSLKLFTPTPNVQRYWIINNTDLFSDSLVWYLKTAVDSITVSLEVVAPNSCSEKLIQNVKFNVKPQVIIAGDSLCVYSDYSAKALMTIDSGNITGITWKMGDGKMYYTDSISHRYVNEGNYQVIAEVQSDRYCKNRDTAMVTIFPKANPAMEITGRCEKDNYMLKDVTLYGNSKSSVVKWNIGGNLQSGFQVIYPAQTKGYKLISMQVETADACTFNLDSLIYVHPLPAVKFNHNSNCGDNTVLFTNLSSNDSNTVLSYIWQTNNNTYTTKNPQVTYSNAGTQPVILTVTNVFGCVDSIYKSIMVDPPIYADFKVNDVCEDEVFSPTNISEKGNTAIVSYDWQFGDNSSSAAMTPVKKYASSGTFNITLTIKNDKGCSFDTTHPVTVFPKPQPGFDINGTPLDIFKSIVNIVDQSSGAVKWNYQISDGSAYSSPGFSHNFTDSGKYTIKQLLTSDKGCTDSLLRNVYVAFKYIPLLANAFSPNDDGINDDFGISGTGIVKAEMQIYNRWGELIFQSANNSRWDGNYMGQPVQNGVYAYIIKVTTYTSEIYFYSGTVHVLR